MDPDRVKTFKDGPIRASVQGTGLFWLVFDLFNNFLMSNVKIFGRLNICTKIGCRCVVEVGGMGVWKCFAQTVS